MFDWLLACQHVCLLGRVMLRLDQFVCKMLKPACVVCAYMMACMNGSQLALH